MVEFVLDLDHGVDGGDVVCAWFQRVQAHFVHFERFMGDLDVAA